MKTGGRDFVDKDKAEKRFRLDEPRSVLRTPTSKSPDTPGFREYLNALDIAAGAVSPAGELVHANPLLLRLLYASRDADASPIPAFPEDVGVKLRALSERGAAGRSECDMQLSLDGALRTFTVVALPFGQEASRLVALTFHDKTRQLMVEQQAQQLMREVDHRVKNTLALVLSISNRTASSAETIDGFRAAFSGRMRALASTHNTLAERSWSSIRIADILAAELRPFPDSLHRQVEFTGTDVGLLPRAAIAIGLILHELIANAVRFGALSRSGGHVTLGLSSQPGKPFVELKWREEGGPEVRVPRHDGFGQAIITRSLQYSPHGGAKLGFSPEGVTCDIRIPVEDLA